MLKHNEVNPLNVHQIRRMEVLPPHFTKVQFSLGTQESNITNWIWENLEGRFYLGDWYTEKPTGGTDVNKIAAFEHSGEASLFALILDTINRYETF